MNNLNDISFPASIDTKRFRLRKLIKSDKSDIYEIYSDELTSLYDDWDPMKDISRAETLISNSLKYFDSKEALRYGIELKENKKIIGVCCIGEFDETNNKCSVYYQINRKEWNKGYATEAVGELVKYAFDSLKVNRIEAYVTPGNEGSIKVLLKNGFVQEGLMREMEFYKNKYQDGIIMGMITKDWNKIQRKE